ncbi:MAG: PHP domain-containing protein [Gemmatimonadales bacterium]
MTPHRRPGTATIRVDLHTHTRRSPDASLRPVELVLRARDAGLDRIAVTDHGEIDGALEARELAPDLVIVGEEIRCRGRTELIGLFLSERIPMGLPIEEVVERIRDQDGVVYAPHPYAYPAAMHAARPVGLRLTHPAAHVASWSMKVARMAADAPRRLLDDGRRPMPASG